MTFFSQMRKALCSKNPNLLSHLESSSNLYQPSLKPNPEFKSNKPEKEISSFIYLKKEDQKLWITDQLEISKEAQPQELWDKISTIGGDKEKEKRRDKKIRCFMPRVNNLQTTEYGSCGYL